MPHELTREVAYVFEAYRFARARDVDVGFSEELLRGENAPPDDPRGYGPAGRA